MWASLTKHWFLISLGACFSVGYFASEHLQSLRDMTWLRDSVVFTVMWMMGVTLRPDTIRKSMTRPVPSMLAIAINVLVVPLLCLPTMWLLRADYFGGLFVAAIVPCTLASASVWTRKADGDDSIAMMTTVVTNLACLAVVPIGIWLVLAQQADIEVTRQVKKLAILVVLPLMLAQIMRRMGISSWADRNKSRISLFGQSGILAMVVFGAVASASTVDVATPVAETNPSGWFAIVPLLIAAIMVHVFALWFGIAAARGLRMNRASQIAVGIAGSQKTLMVGLQIAIDCGVSVVPMLVYHLSQLVIDTMVADRWKIAGLQETETQTTDSLEN
ncbi:MAG: bile acid:sodium symporter family protein [Rubripirellula sp.]